MMKSKLHDKIMQRLVAGITVQYIYCGILFILWVSIDAFGAIKIYDNYDGQKAFIEALRTIQEPVNVGTFKLNPTLKPDGTILEALRYRSDKGYKTNVLLEDRLHEVEKRGSTSNNLTPSRDLFLQTGAKFITLEQFSQSHFKILSSPNLAFVGTTNFDGDHPEFIVRDFMVRIDTQKIVKELQDITNLAIKNEKINWLIYAYDVNSIKVGETRLSWGPFHHLEHLVKIIDSAKKTISIYQQDLQDKVIVEALKNAIKRNVKVRICMSKFPFGPNVPNKNLTNLYSILEKKGQVRLTGTLSKMGSKPIHIHAKVLIADHNIMYLGSANFYPAILQPKTNQLNVGIITRSQDAISYVEKYFDIDWDAHEQTALSHG